MIVAGHICLDIIPTLFGAFEFVPGKLLEAGAPVTSAGGQVSNTGLALHRLGINVTMIAKIADDLFGDAIRRILESHGHGLSLNLVEAPAGFTSYSVILSPPGTDRMFLHATGCNATFDRGDINQALAIGADVFHFGYPTLLEAMCRDDGAELAALMADVKATGATTSLDMSMPDFSGFAGDVNWPLLLDRVLPYVDIFMPSIEEILLMVRPNGHQVGESPGNKGRRHGIPAKLFSEVASGLIASGAKIVGLKAGRRGLYLRTDGAGSLMQMGRGQPDGISAWEDREIWSPCFFVEEVGTTGAGDATVAGFLAALLRKMSPEQAVNFGCAVGACSVEAADAQSGVRNWQETAERIRAGWPRLDAGLEQQGGWTWSDAMGVWIGPSDRTRNEAAGQI